MLKRSSSEGVAFEIPPGESAIVTDNGRLNLLVPQHFKDDYVPELVVALTAVFVRMEREPGFIAEQVEWFKNQKPS